MDCKQAVSFMHDYLDGDLSEQDKHELEQHLLDCPECRMRFKELERTDAMLYGTRYHQVPCVSDELTFRIMNALPPHKRQPAVPMLTWVKRHPAVTAAAFFLIVICSSMASFSSTDHQLVVKGSNLDQVVIQGDTVIVPEGKSIAGDLTVQNGEARVYGDVEGNVTVIDGSYYQASTAHIAGQVKSIDQTLDWIWYKVTDLFGGPSSP
ncbi:zf-HC2 domain-containing protein [Paenibacillus ottowii]|uniref:Anti-sigma-W factor RsiW n=2 Tax=Paenibacillus TaxID=44249 RepID=A0ABY3B0V3_9BACL|nr:MULTISPECIES: zf-HC2 domain-containing protein [Paenibacillus]NEU25854.1 anti-sigma factor [Paenibacillus polymyxa]OBA03979.1 anti-sigma factor [Paenibacillus polymyxa]TQR97118.1 anti-sigma factor [Paenibacillus ottowii]